MRKLKFGVLSFAMLFVVIGCSKSEVDEIKSEKGGASPNPVAKNNDEVIQRLITNLKGSASLTKQTENNDVIFGLNFVSSKAGAIKKLRAYTGQERDYNVLLWKKTGNSWEQIYLSTVTTKDATKFSGDKEVSWLINKDVDYKIGIRIKQPTTGSASVIRLSSASNNITNGSATVGSITFEKSFYYKIHYSGSGQTTAVPTDVGTYLHLAGMVDFDFVED